MKLQLQHILVLAAITAQISHSRRLILDLIDKLRSSQTKSISPSWEGIRRFDLIGTGKLPLQSHKLDTEFSGELLESKLGETEEQYPPPPGYNRRVYTSAEEGRVVPGQFSRNRATADYHLQHQDPETKIRKNYDRFGFTWADDQGQRRRQRRSASPYSRIKIKIPNPFYFSNPARRRVRLKKVVSAPARVHNTERSGPATTWESQNSHRNIVDLRLFENTNDVLQHFDLLEPGLGGGGPESLGSDDDYDYDYQVELAHCVSVFSFIFHVIFRPSSTQRSRGNFSAQETSSSSRGALFMTRMMGDTRTGMTSHPQNIFLIQIMQPILPSWTIQPE